MRATGLALVLLASAAIALGSPLCCLLGTACCGTDSTAKAEEPEQHCCSHCKKERPEQPAPKPCENRDCACKHDVASHAATGEHVPLVAVFEIPAVALPAPVTDGAATAAHRALPLSSAPASHPLLL